MAVVALDELLAWRAAWRRNGQRLVLTNGVFDLLHAGHVAYLEQARALGDILVVGLNSDDSVRAIKGPHRPLVDEGARALVLAALRCVAAVVIFAQPTAEALVAALQPEVYAKGGDYAATSTMGPTGLAGDAVDAARLPEARVVRACGGRVVLLPYRQGYSTTNVIERIQRMGDDARRATGEHEF